MNRKYFLHSLLQLLGGVATAYGYRAAPLPGEPDVPFLRPPYLKEGDMIGITCPAGFITKEEIQPAIRKMEEWGFAVRLGETIGKRDFSFGGTDGERLADLQHMMDDRSIKAIMCARGGYGSVRIIDQLDFTRFVASPKWVIGFSDITVIHNHIDRHYHVAGIHSKMCNSFPDNWDSADALQKETIESIRRCLCGQPVMYNVTPNAHNRVGSATGRLVGRNLKTIESLAGSNSSIVTQDKILFLEDTGEYLYSIDRMLWNLKRTGKLAGLKGLLIGGFKIKPDDPGEEFGRTLEEIVMEKVSGYHYPVCFDFPVGHQKNNFALKCGMRYSLNVTPSEIIFKEA